MTKNLLKIVTLFAFLIIPTELNKNYSPNLEKKEYLETIEKRKREVEKCEVLLSEPATPALGCAPKLAWQPSPSPDWPVLRGRVSP